MKLSVPLKLPKGTCDVLKFIAAILVIIAHTGTTALGPAYGAAHPAFYIMATQNGYIGVAIFFFLSGYGLMQSELKSHLSAMDFFRRRFLKVYLPVLLVTALWLPVVYDYPPLLNSYKSIIYDLFWGLLDPVMWFVRVLIPLYALFYLMTILGKAIRMDVAVLSLMVICIVYAIYTIAINDTIRDHSTPLFALGAFTAYNSRKGVLFNLSIIMIVGLIVSLPVFLTSHPLTGFIHVFFDYCLLAAVVAIISVKQIDVRLPAVLTAITFDIYLVHFKLLMLGSYNVSLPVLLAAIIPVTLVIAWLFMKLRTAIIDNGLMKLLNR